jgi:hypothetical protein
VKKEDGQKEEEKREKKTKKKKQPKEKNKKHKGNTFQFQTHRTNRITFLVNNFNNKCF